MVNMHFRTTISRAEGTYRAERHIECEAHIENTKGIYIDFFVDKFAKAKEIGYRFYFSEG